MNNKRKKHPYAVFLGVVWAFLIVGYIVYFATLYISTDDPYIPRSTYIIRNITRQDYGYLHDTVTSSVLNSPEYIQNPEYREVIAISEYAECAIRRKAYLEAGDTAMTDMLEAKMKDAYSRMNELDFVAEDIDKLLEK